MLLSVFFSPGPFSFLSPSSSSAEALLWLMLCFWEFCFHLPLSQVFPFIFKIYFYFYVCEYSVAVHRVVSLHVVVGSSDTILSCNLTYPGIPSKVDAGS